MRAIHGGRLALEISEQFIVESLHAADNRQRISQPECIGLGHQHLSEAAELMTANIEEPLPLADVALAINLSLRQLGRLFNRYFSKNSTQYYMNLCVCVGPGSCSCTPASPSCRSRRHLVFTPLRISARRIASCSATLQVMSADAS